MNMSRTKPRMRLDAVPAPTVAKFFRRDITGCAANSRRLPPLRRSGFRRLAVEGGGEAAADGSFAGGVGDLVAGEIGYVENVDHPLAEGRDMGRGDVEVEV